MEDLFVGIEDIEELDLNNEFVIKSHRVAEKLKKRGFNIKKPLWRNFEAS